MDPHNQAPTTPSFLRVVLVEPDIPPNTGNIIRLCANTGVGLHLVEPLGFPLEDAKLRRAGLDYHEYASMQVHKNWEELLQALSGKTGTDMPSRMFAMTTHGTRSPYDVAFQPGDVLVFGSETRGLDPELRNRFPAEQRLRLPMRPNNRSLNLANAVAITVFEAWRQLGFVGAAATQHPI